MRMQCLTPMLQTRDIGRAIDWYGSVLGFRCTGRAGGWCRLERDGVAIMFMRNAHIGEPHATATQYINVGDVTALWAAVKDRAEAEWGPEEMSYGLIEFAIKDPDGYLLSFGEPVPTSTPALEMDRRA
jgi:uncharacterized glyoxalase superfamily protein PhnB